MAGVLTERKDRDGFEIRVHARGKPYVAWIGPLTVRQQRDYERHVSTVVDAFRVGDSPDVVAVKWFESVPPRIRDKFVSWGMLPAMQRRVITAEQRTVSGWTELFIAELVGKPRTKNNYEQARTWLLKFIDGNRDIATVTQGDMRRWQSSMSGLAMSTRNKHVKRVKTMFAGAVEDGILSSSPATILKEERTAKRIDRSRQHFVDAATTKKVLRKLPDTNWKLIFCLLRFQGLRRHEVFAIDWSNIDWETNEITVPAGTKTGWRCMPIFPETLEYLRDALEMAKPGQKVVRWVGSQESLTERLKRHVALAVGKCWPKACQQLRSTRRTELDALFPAYVVNEWLGHDSTTAEKHYQQVTPEHLSRAARLETVTTTVDDDDTNGEAATTTVGDDVGDGELVCAMACATEPHRTGENSHPKKIKNPGKPRLSRVRNAVKYPRKDSNLGPAD